MNRTIDDALGQRDDESFSQWMERVGNAMREAAAAIEHNEWVDEQSLARRAMRIISERIEEEAQQIDRAVSLAMQQGQTIEQALASLSGDNKTAEAMLEVIGNIQAQGYEIQPEMAGGAINFNALSAVNVETGQAVQFDVQYSAMQLSVIRQAAEGVEYEGSTLTVELPQGRDFEDQITDIIRQI